METGGTNEDLEVGQIASGCVLTENGMPGREWIGVGNA